MAALTEPEIVEALADLPGWTYDGERISKEFSFPTFMEAIAFIDRVAEAAEAADHHPDLENHYTKVIVAVPVVGRGRRDQARPPHGRGHRGRRRWHLSRSRANPLPSGRIRASHRRRGFPHEQERSGHRIEQRHRHGYLAEVRGRRVEGLRDDADPDKGAELAAEAAEKGWDLKIVALDVRDSASVDACMDEVLGEVGALDALVNNAGHGMLAPVEDASDEEIQAVFDTNVFGMVRVTRKVLPGSAPPAGAPW